MGPYGHIWAHMPIWDPYGSIWVPYGFHMGPYGSIWVPYGHIWAHMGPIWVNMESYVPIWAPYGHMEPYVPIWATSGSLRYGRALLGLPCDSHDRATVRVLFDRGSRAWHGHLTADRGLGQSFVICD